METGIKKTKEWVNFILRRIKDGVETDTMLGGHCSFIEKEKNPEVFGEITKEWTADDLKGCYAVVTFFEDSIIPMYEGNSYYEMTDTGGTVTNRSKK